MILILVNGKILVKQKTSPIVEISSKTPDEGEGEHVFHDGEVVGNGRLRRHGPRHGMGRAMGRVRSIYTHKIIIRREKPVNL